MRFVFQPLSAPWPLSSSPSGELGPFKIYAVLAASAFRLTASVQRVLAYRDRKTPPSQPHALPSTGPIPPAERELPRELSSC